MTPAAAPLAAAARRRGPAFTLAEMLVVLAIITILVALVAPALLPAMRSANINRASAAITDELNLARQLALSQNRDVEIRFYRIGSQADLNDKQYRAFRSFSSKGSGPEMTPLTGVKYLPEPAIFSTATDKSGSTVSTLLDTGKLGVTTPLTETIPGKDGPTAYLSFRFQPTGGTNLDANGNWYLTLYLANAAKNASTGIPDNYFTAQVDPVTGRVRTYRP